MPAGREPRAAPREGGSASPLRGTGELLREVVAFAPRRAGLAVCLLLVAAVTEAFGIVMLIPLLYAIGVGSELGAGDGIGSRIAEAVGAIGVELGLGNVLLLFLAGVVVRAAVSWWREQVLTEVQHGFVDALRTRVYAAMGRASWEVLLRKRQSDIQHTVNADVNRTGSAMMMFLRLPITGLLALVQVAIAIAIAPTISAVALAVGTAALVASRVLVRRSREIGEQMTEFNRRLFGSTSDFLAGMRLAKAYGVEQRYVDQFVDTTAAMRGRQLAFTRVNSLAGAAMNVGGACTVVLLIWLGARAELSVAELAITVVVFARVLPMLLGFLGSAQQLANTLPAYQNVMAMQREFVAAAERVPSGPEPTPVALAEALTLHDVSFAYQVGTPVLRHVDLAIPAGTMTAIGGPSGAGKSTLAELLLGLLRPASGIEGGAAGRILVDGRPLAGELAHRWRRSVAYVPQEPYLFHDTIRGNLLWARPGASEAEIQDALRAAAAEEFVAALPDGVDTVVGDRGGRLSGGERQRVALARALLRQPTLLLLDEATGALDVETEQRVAAALRQLRGRTTVVAIAHQAAVLAAADQVLLVKAGCVAALGRWTELAPAWDVAGWDAAAPAVVGSGKGGESRVAEAQGG